jgi:hypothetical protein
MRFGPRSLTDLEGGVIDVHEAEGRGAECTVLQQHLLLPPHLLIDIITYIPTVNRDWLEIPKEDG